MPRLIDADALIAELCEGCKYLDSGLCDQDICGDVLLMKYAPLIDAVPVVRCKDCKHRYIAPCPMRLSFNRTNGNDFCSYGERRSDD